MFSLFKKSKKQGERDLERVIFDIAEHKRDEDFQLLYRLMKDREVFIPIDAGSVPAAAQPGVPYVTGAQDRLLFRTVELPGNGMWAAAATKPTSRILAKGYVGMSWPGFLDISLKIQDIRGVYLQGETSWVALDKKSIAYVLSIAAT